MILEYFVSFYGNFGWILLFDWVKRIGEFKEASFIKDETLEGKGEGVIDEPKESGKTFLNKL